ncbi:MAG: ribonuclease D [Pseudomonadales bacterium]|nr:ribonuclease D [Pseudomonadales bacterium]
MQRFEVENTTCLLITEQQDLDSQIEQLANAPLLSVDTEFLRTNTFYPIVGLIQVATPDICLLIDPLAVPDLSPLKELLYNEQTRLVMHACSEDMEVLQRVFGDVPPNVFDTQIAASLVSRDHQLGLQKLILNYCNKEIPKDETRSDWTKRPLTENQLTYAALDVVCLLHVYDALFEKLTSLGRLEWCEEECQRILAGYRVESDHAQYYRTMGDAWKLKGTNLNVLQAISEWREYTAREKDRPRGFIFSDRELFSIADQLPTSTGQLARITNAKPVQIRRYGDDVLSKVEAAKALDPSLLASVPKPFNNRVKKVAKSIKPEAEKIAVQLDMATDRLINRRNLEKFIKASLEGRDIPSYFQGWRMDALVPTLENALKQQETTTNE